LGTYTLFALAIWKLEPFEEKHINFIQLILSILRVILLILSASFIGASSNTSNALAILLLVIHISIFVLFAYVSLRRLVLQMPCFVKKSTGSTNETVSQLSHLTAQIS
jgi:hypothetical protein